MKIVPSCVDVAGISNHVTKALEDGNVSLNMNQIINCSVVESCKYSCLIYNSDDELLY